MKIAFDSPNDAALEKFDQVYLREALIATLYYVGKISEKEACTALGVTRREFENILPRFGFAILADTAENIDRELRA